MPSHRDDRNRDRSRDRDRDKDTYRHRDIERDTNRDRDGDRDGKWDGGRARQTEPRLKDRDDDRERRQDRDREKRGHDNDRRERYRDRDDNNRGGRQRSRSPRKRKEKDGEKVRHRRHEASESEESLLDLEEMGVAEISEDDYFLKASEFKYWLKEEKGKYLDQLTSEDSRKYFRRFVRRWNDGALPRDCYRHLESTSLPSSSNTAYKWAFTNNQGISERELAAARAEVDRMTHQSSKSPKHPPESGPSYTALPENDDDDDDEMVGPMPDPPAQSHRPGPIGPSRPTPSDRQLARETEAELLSADRRAVRKAERKAAYERADELVPRGVGKEGKIAERRATNAENKQYRDKEVGGLEMDERTLMGDDDEGSFAAAKRARDAAEARRNEKRAEKDGDRRSMFSERMAERKNKEAATMDMLKALAKQRFG